MTDKKKVLLVSTNGGHFDAALAILPALKPFEVDMAISRVSQFEGLRLQGVGCIYWLLKYGKKKGIKLALCLVVNFFQFIYIFWKSKPTTIVTTGAEVALPCALLAFFIPGVKCIFIESATRVEELSVAGKLVYPFVDRFFVQWPELADRFPKKAEFYGRVF